MKFEIIDKSTFQVKINTSYKRINKENQTNIIKELLLLIKKRYAIDIYGFYEVNIYTYNNLFTIMLFKRINRDDSFYNTIDLKIINHSKELDIIIDDFILKNTKNIYKICEHYYIKSLNLHY